MAIQAGCDMLIYRTEGAARQAYEVLFKALEEGRLSPERVIESADRSLASKRETLPPYQPASVSNAKAVIGCEEHQEVIKSIP